MPLKDCLTDIVPDSTKELKTRKDVAQCIPRLSDLDKTVLPEVPDRYRSASQEAATVDTGPRLHHRDAVPDGAGELEELTALALVSAKEILQKTLKEDDDEYMALLRAKANLVQTIFTAQLRADEGRFRKRQADTLERLLERMAVEESRMRTIN